MASSGVFYGTTRSGGAGGNGTIFKLNADGSAFTNLHSFSAGAGPYPYTNADGLTPNTPVLSSNTLYGTTVQGGAFGYGTVYRINTDGSGFTNLHTFSAAPGFGAANQDGANPYGRLVIVGNTLYGTASGGGHAGSGTVFQLNTDGTAFNVISHLPGFGGPGFPLAGLVLSGTKLIGTSSVGGNPSRGAVFAVNTDGTGFGALHTFATGEGAYPQAGLLLSGNTVYGTTLNGGASGIGTVFKLNSDGTGFSTLHTFIGSGMPLTNVDGGFPDGGLVLVGKTLYGTASEGGVSGWGTLFALNTDGTAFTLVHTFAAAADGLYPGGELTVAGSTIYGNASGGALGNGVLFSTPVPAMLSIVSAPGGKVILSWPTNAATSRLQTATLLPASGWTAVSNVPALVNGQNTVTNLSTGTQAYFRLSQ